MFMNPYERINFLLNKLEKGEAKLQADARHLQEIRKTTIRIAQEHGLEEFLADEAMRRIKQEDKHYKEQATA